MTIVRLQVIKVYDVEVPATIEDPERYALELPTTQIQEQGKLIDVSTDHAEVMEDDDGENEGS